MNELFIAPSSIACSTQVLNGLEVSLNPKNAVSIDAIIILA